MNGGFTKLFNSIITSSVWSEDDKTRIMWVTMLAIVDSQGLVSGSIPGMSAIARMSLKDAEKSIQALCQPDPYSRSKEYEGRRLIEVDRGWLIVNYVKYRQRRDAERRKDQNRQAQKRFRRKQKISQSKPKSAQAEAEAEAYKLKESIKKETCVVDILPPQPKVLDHTQDVSTTQGQKPKSKLGKPKKNPKRKVFKPPTPDQVAEYAQTIGYFSLDARSFCDWYACKGWVVGKSPMKDWRAAVRTWKGRDEAAGKRTGPPQRGDPDWLPTEEEARQILQEAGA